ncbi:TetR/AcrR family transcriptional regulator [Nonomuraea sp. G32]|nr:TetR/AcrR family transcriptional regulator [Nonomuraea sp. G32]MDP4507036.1 TetR/AcrR family transcriptional regulator [Nonomuraea sp. G32]
MTMDMLQDLVEAAVRAARQRGQDVAEVPLTAIAAAAGISRSTLLRRLNGSRATLDEAVRAAGIDPGGRLPVRERAIEAAGRLIGERGLGALTLDAVAAAADCSLPTLHTVFQGRDGLLAAVFDRYSPVLDVEALAAGPPEHIEETIRGIYRALIATFGQEPRVMPALFADVLARPAGPARQILEQATPRMLQGVGTLLSREIAQGRLRDLPIALLIQMMIGPLVLHMLLRPVLEASIGPDLPPIEESAAVFAAAFLRAVTQ